MMSGDDPGSPGSRRTPELRNKLGAAVMSISQVSPGGARSLYQPYFIGIYRDI